MNMLQGKTLPVRVNLFLIVNPPTWFNKVWTIMKGMLSEDFAQKVYMIPESQLSEHLAAGYESFLPDDMANGQVDTRALVGDFVQYRVFFETGRMPMRAPPSPRNNTSPRKKKAVEPPPTKKRRRLRCFFSNKSLGHTSAAI